MDKTTVLALRAKAGDRRALDVLVRTTHPEVHRLCAHLGRPADPDDLAQETYERAIKSLDGFRGDGSFRAWILSIARRVCVDATRRAIRGRRLLDKAGGAAMVDGHHRDAHWLEVDELLSHLDTDRREAFMLTQILGLPYADAAAVLGCPVGTIRSRVARARRDLLTDPYLERAATA